MEIKNFIISSSHTLATVGDYYYSTSTSHHFMMRCPQCCLLRKLFGKAPVEFDEQFKVKIEHLYKLKKAVVKFVTAFEIILKKTAADPYSNLAILLNQYADTTTEETSATIKEASIDIARMGTHYKKFNADAMAVVKILEFWYKNPSGGFIRLNRQNLALKEARSKLNNRMKNASITNLIQIQDKATRQLKEDYDQKLASLEKNLEQLYNSTDSDLVKAIHEMIRLVQELGKECSASSDSAGSGPPTITY